jgi:nucleoside-diphosphate-sugar epimerase
MISILGCGWLGMPLGKALVGSGKLVKGSTTKPDKLEEISRQSIVSFLIQLDDLSNKAELMEFLDNEILIINVPPGRNHIHADDYPHKLAKLNDYINQSQIQKVIFVSSTSVYEENNSVVFEDSFISSNASAQRLFLAEEVFRNNPNIQTTVIRMAGLIGPNRHPGRFFGGKTQIPDGLIPVNLIHLDDCIGIIEEVIQQEYWGQTIHAAAPSHPTKKEFYSLASAIYNNTKADFLEEKGKFKIINPDKLVKDLNYQFKHPDLMAWLLQNHQN